MDIRCFLENRSGNRMSIDVGSRHNRTYIKIRPNKIKIHYYKSIFQKEEFQNQVDTVKKKSRMFILKRQAKISQSY